jgi:kynurenine formamidase
MTQPVFETTATALREKSKLQRHFRRFDLFDRGADTSFGANRLLLREHRIHLENLAGLGEMPPSGGWIIVGGIRIRGGSGSPATVFGLIP